jgi:hypothetical protein
LILLCAISIAFSQTPPRGQHSKSIYNPAYGYYSRSNSTYYHTSSWIGIGNDGTYIDRSYFTPDINKFFEIPQASIIDDVEIRFTLNPGNGAVGIDFTDVTFSSSDYGDRWRNIGEGSALGSSDASQFIFKSSALVTHIQNIVRNRNGSLTIGMKVQDETNTSSRQYSYSAPYIIVYYRDHNVDVAQFDEANNIFGQVFQWENNTWIDKGSSFLVHGYTPSSISLKAQQTYKSGTNQKFHDWDDNNNLRYINYNSFSVLPNRVNNSESFFKNTDNTISIRTALIDAPNICGGQIGFRDPWFIDYQDPTYGSRNRDLNTELLYWRPVGTTGFNPNGQYAEGTYQGVFIDQNPWWETNQPIYTVGALSSQTIGNYPANFVSWTTSGGSVQYQSPNSLETKIVFKSVGATATALYKAHLGSSNSSATSSNNQRKMVYYNGKSYLVYESGGEIWLTSSVDDGATWSNEIRLSDGYGNNSQPSIDAFKMGSGSSNDGLSVVWQHIASPNGINYFLFINARLSDAAATEWGSIQIVTPSMTQVPPNFSGATPVIARTYASYGDPYSKITVVYHGWGTHGAGTFDRVYLSYANSISYTMSSFSSPISLNWYPGNLPTICRKATDNHVVGLAWKENNNIYYQEFNPALPYFYSAEVVGYCADATTGPSLTYDHAIQNMPIIAYQMFDYAYWELYGINI